MAGPLIGIYPGTFDPITNGHTDIIHRAAKMLDRLVVGVAVNAGKGPLFDVDERVAHVEQEISDLGDDFARRISVKSFDNLLVEFAADNDATVIIRGLRAVSDFDYEFQMASMNAKLDGNVETVCLMATDKYQFIASRLVKEIAIMGGDVAPFVSARIVRHLVDRVGRSG
jgi:pantetheine-phosphate adenylyltransferase